MKMKEYSRVINITFKIMTKTILWRENDNLIGNKPKKKEAENK